MKIRADEHPHEKGRPHWLQERASAVVLIPLTLWASLFAFNAIGKSRDVLVARFRRPRHIIALALMAGLTARHMQLGLEVIIGDYLRGARQKAAKVLTRVLCVGFVASVSLSLLQLRRQSRAGADK
ncbi:succinate dehydrogenase, hydrophobic membrane anchor protein [Candidatus Kirkpatrickella diaphorinae]|uniref:Succinate dehydrogenase hydrophobic membrane anchor subunit n=1 Tax=Candidatus Kirkpatrickella diaphorinae TaxID=2984322 RepID=A0ABY6GHX9_9PROT|nr:succinate dehydrogenase, hydrophobic membrane anchor protein [Candidatus Kirkpatrickella diaphorinae]UYH51030.1 succinate dehydrogenase, hydrophobic membrane anchor protein [Candidatus Kirkpatrickella diaphorinae]